MALLAQLQCRRPAAPPISGLYLTRWCGERQREGEFLKYRDPYVISDSFYRITHLVLQCQDNELKPDVQDDLFGVLTTSRIVLLLDDSGSMRTRVVAPGASAFAAGPVVTRWSELERLAAIIVTMVTATTPAGVDVHFLNRPGALGVTSTAQLAPVFANGPAGGTPLITALGSLPFHASS